MPASHVPVTLPGHLYFLPASSALARAGFLSVANRCVLQRKAHETHSPINHLPSPCLRLLVTFWARGFSLDPAIRRPSGYRLAPAPVLWLPALQDPDLQRAPSPCRPFQTPQTF